MSYKFQDIKKISLILIGESTVGKTSLMRVYNDLKFEESSLATIGIEVYTKNIQINEEVCSIKIWDTCGQERLRALSANYYRKADGVILVYDTTSIDSFNNLDYWLKSIKFYCKRDIPIIIIGNKIDLENKIDKETLNDFMRAHSNIPIFNTSAKTGKGINEAFYNIAQTIYNIKKEYEIIELTDDKFQNDSHSC
jgi:small GTP-binding protein